MFTMNDTKVPMLIKEEVAQALSENRAVVALESNVITHGLKYPRNIETSYEVEKAVRQGGAIPATIGIENGKILIGMGIDKIEKFATTQNIPKVSSRDLPVILAKKEMGATSVASSIVAANIANIPFFSSAGIGGVHRGAESTMDISSDLIQFTRSKVAVVCAGAKNILDIGLTLEFLETHCIPVASYQYDDFPAFYCRTSGFPSPHRIDDKAIMARSIDLHWKLGHKGTFLITTPTKEADSINGQDIDEAIDRAIVKAKNNGVVGNQITKYVMHAIDSVTSGRTAKANMAVLINTAEVAGRLASAYKLYKKDPS